MQEQLPCPICVGICNLVTEKRNIVFRDIPYIIVEYYYVCDSCDLDFQDETAINKTLEQIPDYPI